MSAVSKEFVLNPLTALIPEQGKFSNIARHIETLQERLQFLESEIIPSLENLSDTEKRIVAAEHEMIKQVLRWAGEA